MTLQIKRTLMIAGFVIIGSILGFWVLSGLKILVPPIVGGIIGAVVAFLFIKGPEETIANVKKTVDSIVKSSATRTTDIKFVINGCLAINQKLRIEEGISADILNEAEMVLDIVDELAQVLCEQYPSDELTYHVCRTATYQLPRLFEPYFALKPETRLPAEDSVLTALRVVHKDLAEIKDIFQSQGVSAARHRAKTVETKYVGLGSSAVA